MNKFFAFVILAFGCQFSGHAQTYAGLKGGLNLAVLDGSVNTKTDFQPGFHAGIFVTAWAGRALAIQPEVLFSNQGTKFSNSRTGPTDNHLRINALQIPLLVKLYLGGKHFYLEAGPQVGVLLSAKEEYLRSGGGTTIINDVKKDYKSGDFGMVGGVGVEVSRLTLDARLVYGLSDINNNSVEAAYRAANDIGGLHHRVVQVALGFRLL